MNTSQVKMAICYDFDKTLSPDDMQTFTLIPSFGMEAAEFWAETNALAKEHLMDSNLAWMFQLIRYCGLRGTPLSRDYLHRIGKDVPLYPGVEEWFPRMNSYAAQRGVVLEHYIISSGLREIIAGSRIAPLVNRIYASSYLYSPEGIAQWPAQAINFTNKTQFIFRIAKGIFEEYDCRVNDSVPYSQLNIPHENFVYIGDSATDIPCMRLVKAQGGHSIGVYDPKTGVTEHMQRLYRDGRINRFVPADYTQDSEISQYLMALIDKTAKREQVQ